MSYMTYVECRRFMTSSGRQRHYSRCQLIAVIQRKRNCISVAVEGQSNFRQNNSLSFLAHNDANIDHKKTIDPFANISVVLFDGQCYHDRCRLRYVYLYLSL